MIRNVILGLCMTCHVKCPYLMGVGISCCSWLRLIPGMNFESGPLEMNGR